MKIIGLTGGIGSGKSAVAQFLHELGAEVVDLDKVGHEALLKSGGAYTGVVANFGQEILNPDGEIDRSKLGEIVFHDPAALKQLSTLVHPFIDIAVKKLIDEVRRRGIDVLVLEAAAMLEAERTWQVDEVWVVTAAESTILERLKSRPGYSGAEIKRRIEVQLPDEERLKYADVVIANNGTLDGLKTKVKVQWEKLYKRIVDS